MAAGEPRAQEAVPVPREAVTTKRRLRGAIAEVGFDVERDFGVFHADVISTGRAFVAVGRLSVMTEQLAEVLETAAVTSGPRALTAWLLESSQPGATGAQLGEEEVPC